MYQESPIGILKSSMFRGEEVGTKYMVGVSREAGDVGVRFAS
jgi:hypothetical protein